VSSTLEYLKKRPIKGEITLLVGKSDGTPENSEPGGSLRAELDKVMADRKLDQKAALKVVARARGISRSEAYRQLQSEKDLG
jgi:16S rRNA (cytidine1402-2'-O)-methyltransferase